MSRREKPLEESPVDATLSLIQRIDEQDDERVSRLQLADLRHRASQMSAAQRSAIRAGHEAPRRVDAAIMTVVNVERDAAQMVFGLDQKEYEERLGKRFWEFSLSSERTHSGEISAVLMSIGETGNPSATRGAMELLKAYEPGACFLLGMAAGLDSRVKLGDVVAPNIVHYYEPNTLRVDGTVPRHDRKSEPRELYQSVNHYEVEGFDQRIREVVKDMPKEKLPGKYRRKGGDRSKYKPKLHLDRATVACGELLLEDGEFLQALANEQDGRIRAADTEAYGFAVAFEEAVPWAIFRGISDQGKPRRATDWQFLATTAAAVALKGFLETEFDPLA
jgi:nucleoside phosphorylase